MESMGREQREARTVAASLLIWLVNAASLLLAAALFNGVVIERIQTAFVAAFVLSLLSFFIEPVLYLLTLPINVATFGLFTLVVNGCVLYLATRIVGGFRFHGGFWEQLGWAMLAAMVVSFFRMVVRSLLVKLRLLPRER